MRTGGQIVALIFGIILLFPGLCFLGFGIAYFGNMYIAGLAPLLLGIGVLIMVVVVVLMRSFFRN